MILVDRKHPSKPHLDGLEHYQQMYKESIEQPDKFWGKMARDLLTWERDFQTVHSGTLAGGDNAWFVEGRLNASYNCVDRHAFKNPDKPAITTRLTRPTRAAQLHTASFSRKSVGSHTCSSRWVSRRVILSLFTFP